MQFNKGFIAIPALTLALSLSVFAAGHGLPAKLKAMDTNGDGVITRDEWKGTQKAFDRHDRNHDGKIDQADRELRKAAKKQVKVTT